MKYSARGISLPIILITIAGIMTAGAVGYTIFSNKTNTDNLNIGGSDLDLDDKDQEAVDSFNDYLSQLAKVTKGQTPEYNFLSKYEQQELQETQKQIKAQAQYYLQKNPCEATLYDIFEAMHLAGEAQQAKLTDGTDTKLIEWSKTAFRAIVSYEMVATLLTPEELGVSDDEFIHIISMQRRGEIVDTFLSLNQLARTDLSRGTLAAISQMFGYEELADDIKQGKFISTTCIQVFDVSANIRYTFENNKMGVKEKWMMRMTFKDVPLYRYGSSRGLPIYTVKREVKAQVAQTDIANAALMGDWVGGKIVGDPIWSIGLTQENGDNVFEDVLNVYLSGKLSHFDIHVSLESSEDSPLYASSFFDNVRIKIPLSAAFKRSSFSHEEKISKDGAEGIIGLDFVPVRYVTPNEVYDLIGSR